MKLTFIPSEWNAKHVDRFWSQLQRVVPIGYMKDYVAKKGRITRIDFAIDFLNIALQDLLFFKPGSERKSLAYHGTLGELETLYIAANSVKDVPQTSKAYIYDKRERLLSENMSEIHQGLLHCRCEFRHRPETKKQSYWSLNKLSDPHGNLKNRFDKHSLVDFFASQPLDEDLLWHFFGDACRQRGHLQAMDMLPKKLKGQFGEAFQKAGNICWRPNELWKCVPDYIKFLLG